MTKNRPLAKMPLAKLLKEGNKYHKAEDWEKSALYHVEAWNRNPEDKNILVVIAFLMVQLNAREQAIGILEKALEVNGPTEEILSIIGDMAQKMGMYDLAEKLFQIFVSTYPHNPKGHNNLAVALAHQDKFDEAIDILQDAIPVFPTEHDLWNSLGSFVSTRDGEEKGVIFYQEALNQSPNNHMALNNLAQSHFKLTHFEEAEKFARQAIKVKNRNAESKLTLGMTLLATGKLEEGWKNYESRNSPDKENATLYTNKLPDWDGSTPLEELTVLVENEQGVGDELLFTPAIWEIYNRAKNTIIGCDHRLVEMFKRTFPKATIVRSYTTPKYGYNLRAYPEIESDKNKDKFQIDCAIKYGSIPTHFWKKIKNIPTFSDGFVNISKERKEYWEKQVRNLGKNLKVGITWKSSIINALRDRVYSDLEDWEPILSIPDIDFINLQYTNCEEEIAFAEKTFGIKIHNFSELNLKDDLDEATTMMSALDLVLCPGNAPGMQASAVGTPVWWMIGGFPWWTFGEEKAFINQNGEFISAPLEPVEMQKIISEYGSRQKFIIQQTADKLIEFKKQKNL